MKPILIIGGRGAGKSTKARQWLLENTPFGKVGLLAGRDPYDLKRQFAEFVGLLETQNIRWKTLEVTTAKGEQRFIFGKPQRSMHLAAIAADPIDSPEAMQFMHYTERFLATVDSSEWDIQQLELSENPFYPMTPEEG